MFRLTFCYRKKGYVKTTFDLSLSAEHWKYVDARTSVYCQVTAVHFILTLAGVQHFLSRNVRTCAMFNNRSARNGSIYFPSFPHPFRVTERRNNGECLTPSSAAVHHLHCRRHILLSGLVCQHLRPRFKPREKLSVASLVPDGGISTDSFRGGSIVPSSQACLPYRSSKYKRFTLSCVISLYKILSSIYVKTLIL
jgi:hypothetical protein